LQNEFFIIIIIMINELVQDFKAYFEWWPICPGFGLPKSQFLQSFLLLLQAVKELLEAKRCYGNQDSLECEQHHSEWR
jgi:hypothetical protein